MLTDDMHDMLYIVCVCVFIYYTYLLTLKGKDPIFPSYVFQIKHCSHWLGRLSNNFSKSTFHLYFQIQLEKKKWFIGSLVKST